MSTDAKFLLTFVEKTGAYGEFFDKTAGKGPLLPLKVAHMGFVVMYTGTKSRPIRAERLQNGVRL